MFLNTPTIFTDGTWASNFIDAYKKKIFLYDIILINIKIIYTIKLIL